MRGIVAVLAIGLLLVPSFAMAQVSVSASAASCVAPAANLKVEATIDGPVEFARVLFRAEGTTCDTREYFVEMRRGEGNRWWAILPPVADGVQNVAYRIWVQSPNDARHVGALNTVPVLASCAAPAWSQAEQAAAANMAVGLTDDDQNVHPCGFNCNGVGRTIMVDGRMMPNETCRAAMLAAGTAIPAATTGTIMGMSPGTAFLVGGAALAAAAIIIDQNQDDDEPVSPSRPN